MLQVDKVSFPLHCILILILVNYIKYQLISVSDNNNFLRLGWIGFTKKMAAVSFITLLYEPNTANRYEENCDSI